MEKEQKVIIIACEFSETPVGCEATSLQTKQFSLSTAVLAAQAHYEKAHVIHQRHQVAFLGVFLLGVEILRAAKRSFGRKCLRQLR